MPEFTITKNTPHIWHAELPSDWLLPLGVLSDEEQARVSRLVREKDQRLKAFSYYFRRQILSRYLSLLPSELCFQVDEHGKPSLIEEQAKSLCFNVSDTDGLVVVAVSDHEIGVDVERTDRSLEEPGLAKHILSPQEEQYWKRLPEQEAKDYLLKAWVAKEAYVKCLGVGLLHGLPTFSVLPNSSDNLISPDSNMSMSWLSLSDTCVAALCVEGALSGLHVKPWQM